MKETEELELKKSLAQLREGIISLSAMLNKHHYGQVIFGINDDGKVFGLSIGKKTKADITHEIQNNLKPLPLKVTIEEAAEDEKTIIRLVAEGDDTPYSAYGRYYIRVNDGDIQMDAYQLQTFFERKEDSYTKWEETETDFGVEDIDEDLLLECIRKANDNGRLDYVYRNAGEALQKLGLLTAHGKLNQAGWYLFGQGKPVTVKEAVYPTDSRTEFGEIKQFSGNIFACIREVLAYIQNHINWKADIVGVQREETPEIPLRAIREIVINSFAHCSYARKGDYNQYVIYRSSLQIYNPGCIIHGIDPVDFASGKTGSKIRNVLIASVLYKCGYIDAFGTGFERTFDLCAKNGIAYNYWSDEFGFTFVFKRRTEFLYEQSGHRSNLVSLDDDIISAIRLNKYITIPELAERTGKSEPTIYRHMNRMMKLGQLKRAGSRKAGYWEVYFK